MEGGAGGRGGERNTKQPYQQHLSWELKSLPSTLPCQETSLEDNFITMFFQHSLELNKLTGGESRTVGGRNQSAY